ncbi:MAG TPA: hypothetical protein VFB67_13275 [Candidatus Polarisedimenticolaceae bacterium]|nr:hypothetical protein [Candidatus Polarisedimenticolaceae bacterium]
MSERPVVMTSREGVPLFGILHEPDAPRTPRTGVSLLNPGLKYRVAPNRLNVRLARALERRGYYVLRLDPPGIGDSGGDLPELPLPELWQRIQRGALVESVVDAQRVFERECGLAELVGMGNCGGAITSLLASTAHPTCRRLILVDLPVTLRADDSNPHARIRGRAHGTWVLAAYARRAGDWRAWLRLITLRSDVGTIARALRARFLAPKKAAAAGSPGGTPAAPAGAAEDERLNERFIDALEAFEAKGGEALFVTAEQDNNTIQFDTMFGSTRLAEPARARRHRRITIRGANHIYGLPEWRDELAGEVFSWLDGRGGAR